MNISIVQINNHLRCKKRRDTSIKGNSKFIFTLLISVKSTINNEINGDLQDIQRYLLINSYVIKTESVV